MTTPPARAPPLVRTSTCWATLAARPPTAACSTGSLWWPAMRADIQTVVADCDACNRFVVVKAGYNPASSFMPLGRGCTSRLTRPSTCRVP